MKTHCRRFVDGRYVHAALRQPQPLFPAIFASASKTQQASTFAGRGPPQQPTSPIVALELGAEQTPVSGKTRLHIVRRGEISGERRGDRPHLLIAGEQKESRRAAIALDADRIEARLGMAQFAMTVRRHGTARMQVGIDKRPKRLGAFKPRV